MKKAGEKESGASRLLILGGVASAAVLALLLAFHERSKPVPVMSETRDKVSHTLRAPDPGIRKALVAPISQAQSREVGSSPKEPLTLDNALERARGGDIKAADLLILDTRTSGPAQDKPDYYEQFQAFLSKRGITQDEWNTFQAATGIAKELEALENPKYPADYAVEFRYRMITMILTEIGAFGASDPLFAHLLGRDNQGLKDLVLEVVRQNESLPGEAEDRSPDEDIAKLRAWYGLNQ